jgi:HEAT repeat protein
MPESIDLAKLIDQMPTPYAGTEKDARKGILSGADKEAMDRALAALRAGGRDGVVALVGMLVDTDPASDSRARHLLHALVIQSGGWPADERKALAGALASTLGGDKPKEVQGFVIRQIQLCGDGAVVPALGKALADETLCTPATAALLAIRDGAAEQFRAALGNAKARQRLDTLQALGVLGDASSADVLKKMLTDEDRDTRTTAAWALANIGDASAADILLKAADAEGYERIAMTKACLLLAERLEKTGTKTEAAKIYGKLRDTRSSDAERYVREIAEKAMTAG